MDGSLCGPAEKRKCKFTGVPGLQSLAKFCFLWESMKPGEIKNQFFGFLDSWFLHFIYFGVASVF